MPLAPVVGTIASAPNAATGGRDRAGPGLSHYPDAKAGSLRRGHPTNNVPSTTHCAIEVPWARVRFPVIAVPEVPK